MRTSADIMVWMTMHMHNVQSDKQSEEIFGTCAQSQTYPIIIKSFTWIFGVKERRDLRVSGHSCMTISV